MFALELKNVNYKVKGFALKDINITIPKGMITGLVGRNGAGKTTLIQLIANNLQRDSGTILYDGEKYWEDEIGVKRKLGIVYDSICFNEHYTPNKIMKKIVPCLQDFDVDYFNKYMDKFDLPYDKSIVKYSQGMKHKFMLLLTLSRKPEILIMDEPTNGVDPADRYEILDMLQEFVENENHTVVFSTHITSDLDKIADYLVYIDSGRIVLEGEKDQVLEQFRMVEIPSSLEISKNDQRIIGARNNLFSLTGLTSHKEIWDLEEVRSAIPTIEDLAIHISEIHKKEILS